MLINLIVQVINILSQLIILLVIVSVALSYFMDPYHPVRQAVDRIVEPMLSPIRRVVPRVGMFDFSPLILIILVQVLDTVIIKLLSAIR